MNSRAFVPAVAITLSLVSVATLSFATDAPASSLEVVGSQFADRIESGKPIGEGKSEKTLAYFVEVKNPGSEAPITLVWSHDGKETVRQSLDIGHSPKWRTWGMSPAKGAKSIEVRVLDATGKELKKDVIDRG